MAGLVPEGQLQLGAGLGEVPAGLLRSVSEVELDGRAGGFGLRGWQRFRSLARGEQRVDAGAQCRIAFAHGVQKCGRFSASFSSAKANRASSWFGFIWIAPLLLPWPRPLESPLKSPQARNDKSIHGSGGEIVAFRRNNNRGDWQVVRQGQHLSMGVDVRKFYGAISCSSGKTLTSTPRDIMM